MIQEGVLGQFRIGRVVEHYGELPRQADAFVELPQRQQAGAGRERRIRHLDLDGQGLVEIEVEEGNRRRYLHGSFPGTESGLVVLSSRRRQRRPSSNPVNVSDNHGSPVQN